MTAGIRAQRWLASRLRGRDPYDLAAAALIIALLVLVALTYKQYAITNDEEVQHQYGALIIDYYRSGFSDRAVFDFKNLYLYGGLFDIVAVLLAKLLPFEPYDIRHILAALCGIGGIAATWATARLIGGPRAGALAALVLALCGAWYGTMFHHTKDIPFAATMIGATYALLRLGRALPRPRLRHVLGFGLLLGAALGLRAMALLLVGYAGLAILLQLPRSGATNWHERFAFLGRSLLALVPAFVIGYVLMVAAWPWASLAPLNPLRAIFAFAQFHYKIRTLLGGQIYEMADVPRWYVSTYLAIKLPPVMLAGATLALLAAAWPQRWWRDMPPQARLETAFIAFTAMFPIVCQAIGRGPAFTGIRHFLFVVPPLAVLAGIGFDAGLAALERRRQVLARGAFAALAGLLIWQAVALARLHPYEYLFYNALVGGLEGAARRYDTDYWVTIMPEAVQGLEAYVAQIDRTNLGKPPQRYGVVVCGERLPFEKAASKRLQWTDDWDKADFFLAPTHMNCDRMLEGKVIVKVERLGVLIGVVKDRRALRGLEATDPR